MTHASVSHLPDRRGSACTAAASPASHPADTLVHCVTASAAQLVDAWRLWTSTHQPAALHDVHRHLADVVLAACTAVYLIDPHGIEGEPDSAA